MLIAFPVALYTATVVTLLVHAGTADPFWYRVALYANIAGVVMAIVAAVPGLIDLLGVPRESRARPTGIRHAAFNTLALVLFAISAVLLYRGGGVAAPLVLAILGLLSTLVAGALGWTLVQKHHVGVAPAPEEELVNDGEPLQPQYPGTYQETFRTTIQH